MESFALQQQLSNLHLSDPSAIATQMNLHYAHKDETMRYFTLLCGNINLGTGQLNYCQAGHPSPLIVRNSSHKAERPGHGGFPIGLTDSALYETVHCYLQPNDLLILHSDGFVDEDVCDIEKTIAMHGNDEYGQLQHRLKVWRSCRPVADDVSALFITLKQPFL
jgi:sigma-B regulation protein RsbU (phosphoserine phosphatase)